MKHIPIKIDANGNVTAHKRIKEFGYDLKKDYKNYWLCHIWDLPDNPFKNLVNNLMIVPNFIRHFFDNSGIKIGEFNTLEISKFIVFHFHEVSPNFCRIDDIKDFKTNANYLIAKKLIKEDKINFIQKK